MNMETRVKRDRGWQSLLEEASKCSLLLVPAFFSAPLSRVQVLMQTQGELVIQRRVEQICTNPFQIGKHIYTMEGTNSLWRGFGYYSGAFIGRTFLSTILMSHLLTRFTATDRYLASNRQLESSSNAPSIDRLLGLSILTSLTVTSVLFPLEFAYTRLGADVQLNGAYLFDGYNAMANQIIRTNAISGLLRGLPACVLAAVTIDGINAATANAETKQSKKYGRGTGIPQTVLELRERRKEQMAFAMCNYAIAKALCYPLDTVSRRQMLTAGQLAYKYKSMFAAVQSMATSEGLSALYRGVTVSILKDSVRWLSIVGLAAVLSQKRSQSATDNR